MLKTLEHELYEAALKEVDKKRPYLGMSGIGKDCSRALWYGYRNYSPIHFDGRIKMLFRLGDIIEDEIIRVLNLAEYIVEGSQMTFSDFNGQFRGHCDGYIKRIDAIFEAKSANTKKFKLFKKNGVKTTYEIYYDQCQCYMGYSEKRRALLIVYHKDTSELYTEIIHFDPDRFNELKNKAYNIITHNKPPVREEDAFNCTYCDFRLVCLEPNEYMHEDNTCGNCEHLVVNESCHLICNITDKLVPNMNHTCKNYEYKKGE